VYVYNFVYRIHVYNVDNVGEISVSLLCVVSQTDGRYLAIKQCRQSSDDIPDRLKSRWTLECDIMIRLKHPNVVRGYALPPELQELAIGDLPVLSMEYCQHGDLRKVGWCGAVYIFTQ